MEIDAEKANDLLEKEKVRWVAVNFVDVLGNLRSIRLPSLSFRKGNAWEGIDFDGSSVGLAPVDDSDMVAVPDPGSLRIDPFGKERGAMAMVMANPSDPEGKAVGPRGILMKIMERYDEMGLKPYISPEMEFSVYRSIDHALTENDFMGTDMDWEGKNVLHSLLGYYEEGEYLLRPKQAYLASRPEDDLTDYRDALASLLIGMGYAVRYHHHEGGKRQIEIETGYYPALEGADYILYFKYLARNLGREMGLIPTFMPKPSTNDAGNGMHFHISLRNESDNVFAGSNGLSPLGLSFIAGLLHHAKALCAFTNPTINSYRRFVPGYEAPMAIAWGRNNRSALVRVPASSEGKSSNIEIRSPDPSANPYLAATVILAAGLDGIDQEMEAPKEADNNLYKEGEGSRLPESLDQALDLAAKDETIVGAVGKDLFIGFERIKRAEIAAYNRHVPVWDFNKYFGV